MRRSAILITMLFAMMWQSVALARSGISAEALADLQHAVMHWQDEGHHHHDDGSYHLGDSDESTRHLMADHVNVPALLLITRAPLLRLDEGAPGQWDARARPHPFVDGPLRPARLSV